MKIDLSRDELLVTLASLKYLENRYSRGAVPMEYLKEANQDVAKAVEKSVGDLEVVIGKIKKALGNGKGGYLYVKTPDGIYDRKLEKEFGKRIPQNPNPRRNTFFWSEPFSDFVVQDRFGKEVEAAIRARYGDGVRIVKNPEWASKENTWQITTEKTQKGGK